MKVYISGPISGLPDGNRAAFAEAVALLRATGHEPVNPHDISVDHDGPCRGPATRDPLDRHRYGCYLTADFRALLKCDAITFLAGWTRSHGSSSERTVAKLIGLPIVGWDGTPVVPSEEDASNPTLVEEV